MESMITNNYILSPCLHEITGSYQGSLLEISDMFPCQLCFFKINYIFLNYFDMLILKIYFLKNIYYLNIFLYKKYFELQKLLYF